MRADLRHVTSQRDEALGNLAEKDRRCKLVEEELSQTKSRLSKCQQEKMQLERDQRATLSLAKSLQGNVHSDVDYYKRKVIVLFASFVLVSMLKRHDFLKFVSIFTIFCIGDRTQHSCSRFERHLDREESPNRGPSPSNGAELVAESACCSSFGCCRTQEESFFLLNLCRKTQVVTCLIIAVCVLTATSLYQEKKQHFLFCF